MRTFIFFIFSTLFTPIIFGQNIKLDLDNQDIDSIVISTVNWEVLTSADVSCEDFYNTFKDIVNYSIKDSILIKTFIKEINALTKKEEPTIDTRCKIYIYGKSSIQTVCCSPWSVQIGNEFYNNSKGMTEIIERIIGDNSFVIDHILKEKDYPIFPGGNDSIYSRIMEYKGDIYKNEIKDTLNLRIEFYIDPTGNARDIRIINRNKRELLDFPKIEKIINHIFMEDLKWSRSNRGRGNVKMILPLTLYPN